ncbi:hypothetical protein FC14_GL000186 [Ligilactobacillus agilis DSM 20509]|jgi:small multidrug resistance pump|uniref:Small multidrug resistance protein n=2 Tax=Ligilactobacillus agilis TaxID=1601 RepID=A0A0R2AGS4_9LACO|nr:hypothetical protein FC14_GL000186 [Ligilactobacillus agilis DSM 20509]
MSGLLYISKKTCFSACWLAKLSLTYFKRGAAMAYCYLLLAICLELIATNFLKLSAGFSRLVPTIITVSAYCACFYFFSLSLRGIKLSIAYATWSGVGIIFASLLSYFLFKESLTGWQLLGLGLIVCGTIIANLTGGH